VHGKFETIFEWIPKERLNEDRFCIYYEDSAIARGKEVLSKLVFGSAEDFEKNEKPVHKEG